MPDPFDQTLTVAADAFFLLPGTEFVTYRPAAGPSRRIEAIIDRTPATELEAVSGGRRPRLEVLIRNNAADGISSDEVNTGGDKIDVAPAVNMKPITMSIIRIVNHDAGLMLLALQ